MSKQRTIDEALTRQFRTGAAIAIACGVTLIVLGLISTGVVGGIFAAWGGYLIGRMYELIRAGREDDRRWAEKRG